MFHGTQNEQLSRVIFTVRFISQTISALSVAAL